MESLQSIKLTPITRRRIPYYQVLIDPAVKRISITIQNNNRQSVIVARSQTSTDTIMDGNWSYVFNLAGNDTRVHEMGFLEELDNRWLTFRLDNCPNVTNVLITIDILKLHQGQG